MEELTFSVPQKLYEPVLYCNIHSELRENLSIATRTSNKMMGLQSYLLEFSGNPSNLRLFAFDT